MEEICLSNLYKPNTCIFRTQKLISMRLGVDMFHCILNEQFFRYIMARTHYILVAVMVMSLLAKLRCQNVVTT